MKRLLLVTVLGLVTVAAPMSAQARVSALAYAMVGATTSGPGYAGGCAMVAVNDVTPGGLLGGQNTWNGVVTASVVGTIMGDNPSYVGCYLKITFSGSEELYLDDTTNPPSVTSGAVTAGANRLFFAAPAHETTVYLCTQVTTRMYGATDRCVATITTPLCPDAVCGAGGVIESLDPVVCTVLVTIARPIGGVQPPPAFPVSIDPATGDTRIFPGTDLEYLLWDCPPYETRP